MNDINIITIHEMGNGRFWMSSGNAPFCDTNGMTRTYSRVDSAIRFLKRQQKMFGGSRYKVNKPNGKVVFVGDNSW